MRTTPNFIWLEAILRHAITYLEARPDSALAAEYKESVVEALEVFKSTRKFTDEQYLKWRHAFNDVIKAHKEIRLAYDDARTSCIEWGLDKYPDHFVAYTDEELTQRAANEMIAFLEGCGLDADWVEPAIARLKSTIDAAKQAFAAQEVLQGVYRKRVKERKRGYDRAYDLVREFFAAVKPDLDRDSEDYRLLSPYPL